MKKLIIILLCFPFLLGSEKEEQPRLKIEIINENAYVHTSWLDTQWGYFPCNGAIFLKDGKAIIVDTPTDNAYSEELISYVENELNAEIVAVIVNHHHVDCLGGLALFHEKGITSYGYETSGELAIEDGFQAPKNLFSERISLDLSGDSLVSYYLGPAHTVDNTVTYYPVANVLFGGCMVKSLGSGKGNLADADTLAWAGTVEKVMWLVNDSTIVIPGHGKHGGRELLDYTVGMFGGE